MRHSARHDTPSHEADDSTREQHSASQHLCPTPAGPTVGDRADEIAALVDAMPIGVNPRWTPELRQAMSVAHQTDCELVAS